MMSNRFFFAALFGLLPLQAVADGSFPDIEVSYGLGLGQSNEAYVGAENETFLFPFLNVTAGRWSFDLAEGVHYGALVTDQTRIDVGLSYRFAPDFSDDAIFDGLNRKDAVEASVLLSQSYGGFEFGAKVRTDVSDTYDGTFVDLNVSRGVALGTLYVTGALGAEYLDADASEYVFGVSAADANALRSAYAPGDLWIPRIELSVARPVSDTTQIVGFLEYQRLPDEAYASPLVEDRNLTTVGVALMRNF